MKQLLLIITGIFSSLMSYAQMDRGVLPSQQRSTSHVTRKPSGTAVRSKKKPSTVRKVQANRSNRSQSSQRYSSDDIDIDTLDYVEYVPIETAFYWAEEDYAKKDYRSAMSWYEYAANEGHTLSQYYLGFMYENGLGVAKDCYEAAKWYLKATDGGEARAARHLAFMYYEGDGLTQNYDNAFKFFSKAAELGDAHSQYCLGCMYYLGKSVSVDKSKAQIWFDYAAPKLFENGKSLMDTDGEHAIEYFEMASWSGAQYSKLAPTVIGYIYYYGKGGVNRDYSKAFEYFMKASNKGHKPASFYVSLCYGLGNGVKQDANLSKKYRQQSGYSSIDEADKYLFSIEYVSSYPIR